MAFSQPNKDAASHSDQCPASASTWPRARAGVLPARAAETAGTPRRAFLHWAVEERQPARPGVAVPLRSPARGAGDTADGETIYVSGPWGGTLRADARNGELRWQHDPSVRAHKPAVACCDVVNRRREGLLRFCRHPRRLQAPDDTAADSAPGLRKPRAYCSAPTPSRAPRVVGDPGDDRQWRRRAWVCGYLGLAGVAFYTVPGNLGPKAPTVRPPTNR
ncbi:hypothetical protein SSTU70S_00678 [Stutzerimonas stutzeri]